MMKPFFSLRTLVIAKAFPLWSTYGLFMLFTTGLVFSLIEYAPIFSLDLGLSARLHHLVCESRLMCVYRS